MQNHYNLLNREEEREMIPLCVDQGVGVVPWSPLARGRLARPPQQSTRRTDDDAYGDSLYVGQEEADERVRRATFAVAQRHGVSPATTAIAWLLSRPGVTAPVIGVTRPEQLADAVRALEVRLDDTDQAELTQHYVPHAVAGFE
jgi:aryl-alcohol dehydrogenase-like predicted oxidoreductase